MIATRLTGSRCRCSTCGELFNSVSMFERHRVGTFEVPSARRCLGRDEMQIRGWRVNLRGFWIERQTRDYSRITRDLVTAATPLAVGA